MSMQSPDLDHFVNSAVRRLSAGFAEEQDSKPLIGSSEHNQAIQIEADSKIRSIGNAALGSHTEGDSNA